MDLWFENYAKLKLRASSHQTYAGYIKNHIKPNIGDLPIEKLSSLELQKFYKKLLTEGRIPRIESEKQPKGLSAKTVRNINQVISSATDMAVEQKIILTNPTKRCALPKVEHKEMHTLPAEQLSDYVFPSPSGGPISPDSVRHMLHRVLKRAGLPAIRFHDLRHTFATLALQNGADIKTVSGMLGHFSAGFTLDTHAHVTTAAQKETANTMGNVLGQIK